MSRDVVFRLRIDGTDVAISDSEKLKKVIKELQKEITNKALKGESYKELQGELGKAQNLQARLREETKEATKQARLNEVANKQRTRTYKDLKNELKIVETNLSNLITSGKGNTAEANRLREEYTRLKTATSEVRRETQDGSSAYRQMSTRLTSARKELKDLLATKSQNISLTQKETARLNLLQKEVSSLDKSLKDIDAAAGQFQRNVGNYTGALNKFGDGVLRVFGAGFLVGGITELTSATIRGARTMVQAADIQEQAVQKVRNLVQQTGQAAGFTTDQLEEMAGSLQANSVFGDEQILNEVTAQLLTFTRIGGESFERAQVAALDLATVLDGDLQSASLQLGKALNDPIQGVSALSRSGIAFSIDQREMIRELVNSGKELEAQNLILTEVENQYGNAAKAASEAGLGAFRQLQNEASDLLEPLGLLIIQIGNVFVPILRTLVGWLGNVINGVLQLTQGLSEIPEFVERNKVSLTLLVTGLAALNFQLVVTNAQLLLKQVRLKAASVASRRLISVNKLLAGAQTVLNNAMRANPIGLIITAVGALILIFRNLFTQFDEGRRIVNAFTGVWKAGFGLIMEAGADLVEAFKQYLGILKSILTLDFKAAWQGVKTLIKEFNPIDSAINAGRELVNGFVGGYNEEIIRADIEALKVRIDNEGANKVMADLKEEASALDTKIQETGGWFEWLQRKAYTGMTIITAGLYNPQTEAQKLEERLREVNEEMAYTSELALKQETRLQSLKARYERLDEDMRKTNFAKYLRRQIVLLQAQIDGVDPDEAAKSFDELDHKAQGSIEGMRENLQALKKEFYELTASEREGDKGKKLAAQILEAEEELNKATSLLSSKADKVKVGVEIDTVDDEELVKGSKAAAEQLVSDLQTELSRLKVGSVEYLETQIKLIEAQDELNELVKAQEAIRDQLTLTEPEAAEKQIYNIENQQAAIKELQETQSGVEFGSKRYKELQQEIVEEQEKLNAMLREQKAINDEIVFGQELIKLTAEVEDIEVDESSIPDIQRAMNELDRLIMQVDGVEILTEEGKQRQLNLLDELHEKRKELSEDLIKLLEKEDEKARKLFQNYTNEVLHIFDQVGSFDMFGSQKQQMLEFAQFAAQQLYDISQSFGDNSQKWEDLVKDSVAAISQILSGMASERAREEIAAVNKAKEGKLSALEEEINERLELVEGDAEAEADIQREFEEKKHAIELEAARERQQIARKEAVIKGALAILNIWATAANPIIAGILSAAMGIITAKKVAEIDGESFYHGGFTSKAPTIAEDRHGKIKGYVHDDEYVSPAHQVKRYPTLFRWLDSDRRNSSSGYRGFVDGGFASTPPAAFSGIKIDNVNELSEAIAREVGMSVNRAISEAVPRAFQEASKEISKDQRRVQRLNENLSK